MLSRLALPAKSIAIWILLVATTALRHESPLALLWTAPLLLFASLLIAWAAESAQYFIAQGFALAILAWLQTLPEFAVEAVLAWRQQAPLLISNLTGALRLLTGVGWPLIYFTTAAYHRARGQGALRHLRLDDQDSVQVLSLLGVLVWVFVIFFKGSLGLVDAAILIAMYLGYLALLNRVPPEEAENPEEMERIPRAIVLARPSVRNTAIVGLFLLGGALIFFVAEPFLGSLLAVAGAVGISQFVAVQWIAPFVSEFPEKVSAFYWARTVDRAPMALMNMVSSNINQWTLLAAMLPIVYSIGAGRAQSIPFDRVQELELLMTAAQSLLGALLLLDLVISWWEAGLLFVLWAVQFGFSVSPQVTAWRIHELTTVAYFGWCAFQTIRLIAAGKAPAAFRAFRAL
jgi:cation:H+ antiporter